MQIYLTGVKPISSGEEAELSFSLCDGENFEKTKMTVSAEMLFELGFSAELSQDIEIDTLKYDEISFLAEKTAAIKKGIYILSFGDNTKKTLSRKLVSKGFSREASNAAADFLDNAGYINESESAALLASDLADKKLYGLRRIKSALIEKGFSRMAVDYALENIDMDFSLICAKRIKKLGGKELFRDETQKKKTVAALMRYGFSYDEIKKALVLL